MTQIFNLGMPMERYPVVVVFEQTAWDKDYKSEYLVWNTTCKKIME